MKRSKKQESGVSRQASEGTTAHPSVSCPQAPSLKPQARSRRLLPRRRIANYWGHADRKGSVLIVVIGLLLLLMLVGFTFFTFASQEHVSAEYYCDSMKNYDGIDTDRLMDFALRQLIIGPNENERQSALWPGRHSLVPNALGMLDSSDPTFGVPKINDRRLFNGTGINVISGPNGQLYVDQDFNGVADSAPNQRLLEIHHSQLANALNYGRTDFLNPTGATIPFPSIDPGYTYPDVNNVFLAYIGKEPTTGALIITPSFHRPVLLRDSTGAPYANWYQDPATANRVLRPHPDHLVLGATSPTYNRFLSSSVTVGAQTIQPFPFAIDRGANAISGEQGVWSNAGANYDYDADNDGNGTYEGVLLDLGFPMQTLPDGRSYVVLYSMTVLDADGLVNLNQAGNLAGFTDLNRPFGANMPISRSNLGQSPTEINPWWALFADPTQTAFLTTPNSAGFAAPELQAYRAFFDQSIPNPKLYQFNRVEMGNLDLLFLMWGRAKFNLRMVGATENYTIKDLIEGRWGEGGTLYNALTGNLAGGYPRPGQPNVDDDGDQSDGTINEIDNVLGAGVVVPPLRYPTDFDGSGLSLAGGTTGLIADKWGPAGWPVAWKRYTRYQNAGSYATSPVAAQVMLTPNSNGLLDATYRDADEMVTDRRYQEQFGGYDQIYGPEETAALHLSPGDFKKALGSSRLRQIMPFNFELNLQADVIRKLFTTESWDRREHGFRATAARPWEFNSKLTGNWTNANDTNGNGIPNYPEGGAGFPPTVAALTELDAQQPFRPELRAAIAMEIGNTTKVNWPQWRLNINRFLTAKNPTLPGVNPVQGVHQFDQSAGLNSPPYLPGNPLQYRHLTPHPVDPGAAAIPTTAPAAMPPFASAPTPAIQEYWARRDRQQMARDIYVMLYMFGGGLVREVDLDGNGMLDPQEDLNGNGILDNYVDYSSVSNAQVGGKRKLYDEWQLQEMAQFAVNYVDALDRDDAITMFEYDVNLADGWNLDDNAYSTTGDTVLNDRRLVFGIEAQQLTINEALVIDSMKVPTQPPTALGFNHPATRFDDSQRDRFYAYVELQNVSPYDVPVGSTGAAGTLGDGAWQIAVEDSNNLANNRLLTLYDAGNVVPAGGLYTVGSRTYVPGGTDDVSPGVPRPSVLDVDPNYNPSMVGAPIYTQIAPAGALSLDLVANSGNGRFTLTDIGGTNATKGTFVAGVVDLTAALTFPYEIRFVLRRRLHLSRSASAPVADNPWIEVDRFQVQVRLADQIPANDTAVTKPQILSFRLRHPNDPMIGGAVATNDIQPKLAKLRSVERIQPLSRTDWDLHSATQIANTIGQINQQASIMLATYPDQIIWQPQFDRDFTSVADLLSIPLYGPTQVVDKLSYSRRLVSEVFVGTSFDARTAQAKFLRPDFPDNVAPLGSIVKFAYPLVDPPTATNQYVASSNPPPDAITPAAPSIPYDGSLPPNIDLYDQWRLDNRWHRILELLEVPSRANMQVEKYLQTAHSTPHANYPAGHFGLQTRRPGRLNLNGIRNQEVLLSLLDDPYSFNMLNNGADLNEPSRLWWRQFLVARDGYDPAFSPPLVLPGSPVSRPYRDLSTVDGPIKTNKNIMGAVPPIIGVPPIEQTLLRRLMIDDEDLNSNGTWEPGEDANGNSALDPANPSGTRRHLEARTSSDLPLPALPASNSNLVDYQTRHRLLAKVSNNSTNRSNVYVVWISAAFFDAYQPDPVGQPGVVQIGGEMTDQPRRRGFFVVDRSLLEEGYRPQNGRFDFAKFIQYRKTIEE